MSKHLILQRKYTETDLQKLYPSWQDTQFHAAQLSTARKTSVLNLGSVPDMDDYEPLPAAKTQENDGHMRPAMRQQPIAKPVKKSYDEELNYWWNGESIPDVSLRSHSLGY